MKLSTRDWLLRTRRPVARAISAALVMAVVCGAGEGVAPAQVRGLPIDQWLDRYEGGDFDAVVTEVERASDRPTFSRQIAEVAPDWINARGPAGSPRRRLAAATLALEVARLAVERLLDLRGELFNPVAGRILEWGCQLLRAGGPPVPAERWWHLAAIAMMERAFDSVFLIGTVPRTSEDNRNVMAMRQAHGAAVDYLAQAAARFPDEPRLRLARLVTLENHSPNTWGWLSRGSGSTDDPALSLGAATWRGLVGDYLLLANDDGVRAEAHLRAGVLQVRLGRFDDALAELGRVEPFTDEPFLIYLSRFFRGKASERAGHVDDAEAAYRSALAVIPRAESGSTALAALLFLRNDRAEATSIAQDALAQPMPADPWRLYWTGDYRLWPALVARLRAELK